MQEYSQLRERYLRTTNALASAAHDLKTPLAILNGYVELLQSEKLGELNDRQREVLRDMRSNGHRLQHYIQDFLSFSVLETGELRMRFETANVNSCFRKFAGCGRRDSRKRAWRSTFSRTKKSLSSRLTRPRWRESFRISWRILTSSRPRAGRCGCTRSRTCGNAARQLFHPQLRNAGGVHFQHQIR